MPAKEKFTYITTYPIMHVCPNRMNGVHDNEGGCSWTVTVGPNDTPEKLASMTEEHLKTCLCQIAKNERMREENAVIYAREQRRTELELATASKAAERQKQRQAAERDRKRRAQREEERQQAASPQTSSASSETSESLTATPKRKKRKTQGTQGESKKDRRERKLAAQACAQAREAALASGN